MAERTGMNLRLTEEARRGWDRACRRYGVNLTALAEAIGLDLDRNPGVLGERAPQIVEHAREIQTERDRRR